MKTERTWNIISIIFLIAAATCLLLWHIDAAFVTATLGVMAWFLGVRDRLRSQIVNTVEPDEDENEDEGIEERE